MTDEQKALAEKLNAMQQQNLIEGRAEIDEVCKRRGLVLVGVPQYVQRDGIWGTAIQVGVAPAKEDA